MSEDTLFAHVERLQGDTPWGDVLDAGTGKASLEWIAGLDTRSWTAITGDPVRARKLETRFAPRMRVQDRIVAGNWTDPLLLHGDAYDVVVADYLLGAVDGFAPYFQDRLFARLLPLTRQRLYAVGLTPYPDAADNPWAEILLEIVRLRDACILLAGHRTYREYPVDWVERHLEAAGYVVEDVRVFPIRYGPRFVREQLAVAERKLPLLDDRALAAQLERTIAELRDRALARHAAIGSLPFGQDWVVHARPA